jgi:hypothetical protein
LLPKKPNLARELGFLSSTLGDFLSPNRAWISFYIIEIFKGNIMSDFCVRISEEYINKFNGQISPAIYELDFEDFKKLTYVRKELGTQLYPMNHFEVGNKLNKVEVDACLLAKTENEALHEIYEELRNTAMHYKSLEKVN